MITTRQVAEAAGVSVSTVGRALSGDIRISETTRERIQLLAATMGYVENRPARIMRGGNSKLIGLLLPDIRNEFYASIADALSTCCEARGYLLTLGIASDARSELRYVKELIGNRAAGLIIVPTMTPHDDLGSLLLRVPHVQFLRRIVGWQAPWFGLNDEASLFVAAKHLAERGHSRIAYIGGYQQLSTGADRLRGVVRALAAHHLTDIPDLKRLGPPTYAFGREATEALLDSIDPPTAIISGSVQVTKALMDVLYHRKVRVPDEVSIVGFGDIPGSTWWQQGLSTTELPVRELASACGDWLLDHLTAGETMVSSHCAIFDAQLLLRGSTVEFNSAKP